MWFLPPVKLPPRQRLKFPHDTHMSITLELPEQITEDLPAHRAETQRLVMTELALTLYAQGKLPPGRAAETAGMGRWEFLELARQRAVPLPYTQEMLTEDIAYGLGRE